MATKHPARQIQWWVVESSNVHAVGYDSAAGMYVRYINGGLYLYHDVSRQRVVACVNADSVGKYINQVIKPRYAATLIAGGE